MTTNSLSKGAAADAKAAAQAALRIARTPAHLLLPSDIQSAISPARMAAIDLVGLMDDKDKRRLEKTMCDKIQEKSHVVSKHIRPI